MDLKQSLYSRMNLSCAPSCQKKFTFPLGLLLFLLINVKNLWWLSVCVTSFYFSIQNMCDLSGDNWKPLLGFKDLVSFPGVWRQFWEDFWDIWVNIGDSIWVRFGKLVTTQSKPCCISKSMGIHFPHPIFMSIFEKKWNFLVTWLSSDPKCL